jgi:thiamine biosynthesis lipoprotein
MIPPHRFEAMGCEVLVAGASRAEQRAVEQLFAERDQRFSRFIAASELNRVNARSGCATRVSREFAELLELALTGAEQTGGLVDPTLGGSLEAAGYDRDFSLLRDDPRAPGAASGGCWSAVRVRGRIVSVPPGVGLDLNGVVKGKTVDDALALLDGEGYVSAGGDLAVRGGGVIGFPGGGAVHLLAGALATSGRDRRRWSRGGERQHHLLDPASGRPSDSPWETVTACGASCVGADLAAKAGFLLGEAGPARLDDWGLPGWFVDRDGRPVANAAWRSKVAGEAEATACT